MKEETNAEKTSAVLHAISTLPCIASIHPHILNPLEAMVSLVNSALNPRIIVKTIHSGALQPQLHRQMYPYCDGMPSRSLPDCPAVGYVERASGHSVDIPNTDQEKGKHQGPCPPFVNESSPYFVIRDKLVD